MIHAVGTDIVEVERIAQILKKWPERFVRKVYTREEIRYCTAMAYPAQHFAARFAAKEAAFKAMGRGIGGGVGLTDVEVITGPEGRPELRFYGKAREIADRTGITERHISLSHTDRYAVAVIVLEK